MATKRKYDTPTLLNTGIQDIMKEDMKTKQQVAKQLRGVAVKRVQRMYEKYGQENSYKIVKSWDNESGNITTDDINNMSTNELVHYIKRTKDFLNAKTTITRYEEMLDKTWEGLERKIDFKDADVSKKRMFALHWSYLEERLRNTRSDLYNEYTSSQLREVAIEVINNSAPELTIDDFEDEAFSNYVNTLETGSDYHYYSDGMEPGNTDIYNDDFWEI